MSDLLTRPVFEWLQLLLPLFLAGGSFVVTLLSFAWVVYKDLVGIDGIKSDAAKAASGFRAILKGSLENVSALLRLTSKVAPVVSGLIFFFFLFEMQWPVLGYTDYGFSAARLPWPSILPPVCVSIHMESPQAEHTFSLAHTAPKADGSNGLFFVWERPGTRMLSTLTRSQVEHMARMCAAVLGGDSTVPDLQLAQVSIS
jgi:hypothetical protein